MQPPGIAVCVQSVAEFQGIADSGAWVLAYVIGVARVPREGNRWGVSCRRFVELTGGALEERLPWAFLPRTRKTVNQTFSFGGLSWTPLWLFPSFPKLVLSVSEPTELLSFFVRQSGRVGTSNFKALMCTQIWHRWGCHAKVLGVTYAPGNLSELCELFTQVMSATSDASQWPFPDSHFPTCPSPNIFLFIKLYFSNHTIFLFNKPHVGRHEFQKLNFVYVSDL